LIGLVPHLVAKDLKRKARSPLGLVIVLSFPVLFAGMIALAFGRGGDAIPKVRMLVANQDDGLLGNALASAFSAQQAARVFETRAVGLPEGLALMERGKASALLVIPAGFTRDLLDGRPVTLKLTRNPSEGILPEIAEQTVGTLVDVLEGGRRVLEEPLAKLRPMLDGNGEAPTDAEITGIALVVKRALEKSGDLIFPPAITLESELLGNREAEAGEPAKKAETTSVIFLLILPGVAVYAIFLVGDQAMRDVMTERALGTLRRQLAGPVTISTYVLGKAVTTAVLCLLALLVLTAVGAVALREPVSFPAFVIVSLALILAITGTSAVIYGLARTERQASTLSSMIYLAMAFIGGSFFRIEGLPAILRRIAPVTPFYWATQAYRMILEKHAGVSGILTHAAILAAIGTVLLTLGGAALRRAARRGAAA
jgi:linearmycin/streptolysin S transport system permease protein